MKNKISKSLNFLISLLTLFPNVVLALSLPGGSTGSSLPSGSPITLTVLEYIIFRISTFLITTSAVLALIFIVWSGITYMYAGEDTAKVDSAKARLRSGIIGAAIVFGVGVIIQTVASVVTLDFFCTVRIPVVGTCIY